MAENTGDNVIFVGKKVPMAYVLAVITQFNDGKKEVVLRARGKAISRAVDVAEIVRNKFFTDVKVKDVKIGTEEMTNQQGEKVNVSTIEIVLAR
jgi:DNA-binding protein